MIGIVLATHGDLSSGLLDSVNIIMGKLDFLQTVSLKNNTGIKGFEKDLREAIGELHSKDGVLVMTDLKGGTPYNCSYYLSISKEFPFDIRVVCGVNLPMLLETLALRESVDIEELAEIAIAAGKQGIDFPQIENSKEDEL